LDKNITAVIIQNDNMSKEHILIQ